MKIFFPFLTPFSLSHDLNLSISLCNIMRDLAFTHKLLLFNNNREQQYIKKVMHLSSYKTSSMLRYKSSVIYLLTKLLKVVVHFRNYSMWRGKVGGI